MCFSSGTGEDTPRVTTKIIPGNKTFYLLINFLPICVEFNDFNNSARTRRKVYDYSVESQILRKMAKFYRTHGTSPWGRSGIRNRPPSRMN